MAEVRRRIGFCSYFSKVFSSRFARAVDPCARVIVIVFASCLAAAGAESAQSAHWVVSWGASPAPPADAEKIRKQGLEFNNQTLREVVHLSMGGPAIRVRFSNVFGRQSLEIGAAHVALRTSDSTILPSSDRALTFGGAPGVSVPPNAVVVSDPVDLVVPGEGDLAISIFVPHVTLAAGMHSFAQQTSYVGTGDLTAAPSIANARAITSWIFLAGLDVSAPLSAAAIAVFGDSRVDGDGSTPNANRRWPDALAHRLSRQGLPIGVLNAGIIGNRILHDAPSMAVELGVNGLARFDRDALDQPGIKYVVVLEGIVDIGLADTQLAPASEAVSVDELIEGMKQLIVRAHDRGMKVYGATQTPFSGTTMIPGMFSAEKETQRKALNQWIRSSHAFDGVIDFEKAVLDPANPDKLRPAFDSGDHIHPNDAGYEAMSNAVDLGLFQ